MLKIGTKVSKKEAPEILYEVDYVNADWAEAIYQDEYIVFHQRDILSGDIIVYEEVECPIARQVAERVASRAKEGMKKYGVTMERTDVDVVGWIDHAIEEALDFAVYLTRLKKDLQK